MRGVRTTLALLAGGLIGAGAIALHPQFGDAIRNEATAIFHPQAAHAPPPELATAIRVVRYDGGFDHFLGPHVSLRHTGDHKYGDDPKVRILIDKTGTVVHAVAISGATRFADEAERKMRTTRFIPFQRNGVPTYAVIDAFMIRIRSPEQRPDYREPFPSITDWRTLKIQLDYIEDRGAKRWTLAIAADGTISFAGEGAAISGNHHARISQQELRQIVDALRSAEWFWTPEYYYAGATHQDVVFTLVAFDNRQKVLAYSPSIYGTQPDAIRDAHATILRVTNADRWVAGNAATAPSLAAENWDFKARSHANLSLLTGLARHGPPRAFSEVRRLGAPVLTDWTRSADGLMVEPPIIAAAGRDDGEILSELLGAEPRWASRALDAALLAAVSNGRPFAADLLSAGANAQTRDTFHRATALMLAAGTGVKEVVTALLYKVADPQAPSFSFYLPLDETPDLRRPNVRAYVNEKDADEQTALHFVADGYDRQGARTDRRAVTRVLIQAGADIEARDKKGRTPLIEAGAQPDVASELISAGADINAADNDGRTPLMESYYPWLTRLLLEKGADIDARDKEGKSALDLATDSFSGARETKPVLEWWLAKRTRQRSR